MRFHFGNCRHDEAQNNWDELCKSQDKIRKLEKDYEQVRSLLKQHQELVQQYRLEIKEHFKEIDTLKKKNNSLELDLRYKIKIMREELVNDYNQKLLKDHEYVRYLTSQNDEFDKQIKHLKEVNADLQKQTHITQPVYIETFPTPECFSKPAYVSEKTKRIRKA